LKNLNLCYILLYFASLGVMAATGLLLKSPGYMDADYYYAGGIQLADGKGFSQPYLWNYLDDNPGVPAPANTFWMPLVSILIAPGFSLFHSFAGARILLWLLAAAVPPVTVYLGQKLHLDAGLAILGGIFALFPAFYLVYLPTTDSFALYMLLGSAFLITSSRLDESGGAAPFLLGILAGLLHMTRADGILWLAGAVCWIFWRWLRDGKVKKKDWLRLLMYTALCLAGYLVISSSWYIRNLQVFGSLFPPGGSKTLWLTQYEDLFLFPGVQLSFSRWWGMGWAHIISAWGQAFWSNLQTVVAVQGSTTLTPFIFIGLYKLRRHPLVQFGAVMWLATLLVFSLVFPFQGINGSFFHSGAAFQALFWAAAPMGVMASVEFIARLRKWQRGAQVQRFVSVLLVGVCVLLSLGLSYQKVAGSEESAAWGSGEQDYARADAALRDLGATPCELVMVNNPPGYYLATGRSSVVIPYGDETMLFGAAKKYKIQYLVLDQNNGGHLPRLYLEPGSYPGLRFLTNVEGMRIYEFIW
jgi:hypothetical protein